MRAMVLLAAATASAAAVPSNLNYGGRGFHQDDPFVSKFTGNEAAPEAPAMRQLQASGQPDKCTSDESFQAWLDLVNSACCQHSATPCANGLPSSCDQECANVLKPFQSSCKAQLRSAGMSSTVKSASRSCPSTSSNTRGCPANIPSVPDQHAQQAADCPRGNGFFPVGSVCTVTCSAGGGHRRAQAGSSKYICVQGGWLSTSPIQCSGGSAPVPPPAGSSRYAVGPTRVPATEAAQYCRTNYQTLASIHSADEQSQAAAVCQTMDPGESYGCWIGFEDSAQEGGFVWSDGSNADFVNFSPGEPNNSYGSGDENYVALSFRGTRNGRWNDETENPDTSGFSWGMNFPLCQTQVPPSDPTKLRVWGTGAQTSLNIRICVDADDYLYFQDDRLWLQYGGNWGAAGNADLCPEEYIGKAYVAEQEWDISGLQACQPGSTCPVSSTFTDPRFTVPQGCASVQTQVTQNSVRGQITVTEPSANNGFRGELHLSDPYMGADVFDFTISLTCLQPAPHKNVRLSCVHNAGGEATAPCNMGRMEVFNPNVARPGGVGSGAWGSVCGQWIWNNNNAARIFCQELGFADGEIYTFGATNYLPTLPIVEGWKVCQGDEGNLLDCPMSTAITETHEYDPPSDLDCATHGCAGADGIVGTADDSIDDGTACLHEVDQGAICYEEAEALDAIAVPRCGNGGTVSWFWRGDHDAQQIAFGCIDYYTTQCTFDASTSGLNTHFEQSAGGHSSNVGTYMWAMRAFARCTEVRPQAPGYCHGSISTAAQLANHEVCRGANANNEDWRGDMSANHADAGGATTNIGYHIRMPFYVVGPGDYTFRMHADYGLGSFMGVDGAEYTPGNIWGHVAVDATALTAGTHEFDVLGFEDCCDGHAEMEVHLPCDSAEDPWRIVVSGESECLQCDGQLDSTCSADTESAGCCGNSGGNTLCHPKLEDGTCGSDGFGDHTEDASTIVGRFIAVGEQMEWEAANDYCNQNYAGLASIHSPTEQDHARAACRAYADASGDEGAVTGCWIGLTDMETNGGFVWSDGAAVDFVSWASGEPNGFNSATTEDQVAMMFYTEYSWNGHWNDADGSADTASYCANPSGWTPPNDPDTDAWCQFGGHGYFPLCQVRAAPPPEPGSQMVWGTGQTSSFRVQVCVDHIDNLFFQDDRLWFQYGGQYSAAGTHGSCPDRYIGKAYINSVEWDISSLAQCEQGVGCPVSSTFTDPQFMVPDGCASYDMMATKNGGRGIVSSFPPSRESSFRGELEISDDGFSGADVYDVTVTVTCRAGAPLDGGINTAGAHNVRLSCVHQSQMGQTDPSLVNTGTSCRMGRVEVYNPNVVHENGVGQGTWGTVCGHYYWDNEEMANIVCRQLGFASGVIYTFGTTNLLPTLPIVAGFQTCAGTENNIFECAPGGAPQDPNCWIGCRGADGIMGTADDSIDPTCTHAIDQGVICMLEDSPQARNQGMTDPCHSNSHGTMWSATQNTEQPAVFACIEYYTTQCVYDITNSELANGLGSYMRAMRAFAECAEVVPEPCGYCHDAIDSARFLANHDVCAGCDGNNNFGTGSGTSWAPTDGTDGSATGGATTDIGFHIRIPFRVNVAGLYTFRYHMDMGLGSFMGVDGPEFRPGNAWGHVEAAGTSLTVGEHEWEVLGFEDCCDGHAELEVHLPCDRVTSPWRIVAHGESPCLSCSLSDPMTEGPVVDGQQRSCASENEAAACCRQEGNGCDSFGGAGGNAIRGDWCGGRGGAVTCSACDDPNIPPTSAHVGRFVAVGTTMSIFDALDYCEENYQGLASIHSYDEAQQAKSACQAYSDSTETIRSEGGNALYGCWIGFQDLGQEGGFVWMDGSSVGYVDWAPGEPNDVGEAGEDAVEMDFRERINRQGEWNDATQADDYLMFPLCETSIPAPVAGEPMNWGTQTTSSFRVRICIDHIDDIMFQDDRLWIQYGGQYSAAGTHGDCPSRYHNKAYINNDVWDITALGDCVPGSHCPVSPTYTDEQFEVPMGCSEVTTTATTLRGRGEVTTEAPSAGNAWRGVLHIEDRQGSSDVYDVRVQLTCVGRESSAPVVPVRLSCTHNFGTDSCHMGRIEVWAPAARHVNSNAVGTWGTVCGHWFWEGDGLANVVCRQLGYSSGATYTFGHTAQLPHLPVVAGFRVCDGSESNIFHCPMTGDPAKTVCTGCVGVTSPDAPGPGQPVDMDCLNGCLGPDHVQGTSDDTVDPTCPHSLDQGAICHNEGESQVALPHCGGFGGGGPMTECQRGSNGEWQGQCNYDQPAVFGCIDYYTTQCTFDVVNTDLANNVGSYMLAMRSFAQCAAENEEAPGYCHGALNDAKLLANQAVCTGGVTTNIGFHIRIPFKVNMVGTYTFRMHADYGLGAYVGIDGAAFTSATWGHVELEPASLTTGEHEFEALGFEDCCDGHSELEVHLPCDGAGAAWRFVSAGSNDCLVCGTVLDASCSYVDTGR